MTIPEDDLEKAVLDEFKLTAIIAVNKRGRILVLEGFPDDEFHGGLHEMLEFAEDDIEVDYAPGLYIATFGITNNSTSTSNPEYDNVYLDIEKMEPINEWRKVKENE